MATLVVVTAVTIKVPVPHVCTRCFAVNHTNEEEEYWERG